MTPQDARARAFLSYARSDGEAFARELRTRLEAEGVPLWRDREGMEGGRDWWQQITAAIDRVEFLVLVITPAALQSAMVRREWRYARQRGVAVYPVLGMQAVAFDVLPRWMRSVHFYDLAHEWPKFVNDLHTRPTPVRVPFMVEDLPPDFVPRPHEYQQILAQLLDREREEPIAITAALRGAGGYGKTALARAICHDEAIQNAFDDGILWVTLGEQPGDLTGRVEDLIYMLCGQRPGFAGLQTAVAALSELLADRELLIVIDDVWDAAHVRPFLQGGERCARIITSRLTDALPAGAWRINVDAMSSSEAVSLLMQGLPPEGAEDVGPLATRLGEWPLLLKLVNGALRERVLHGAQPLAAALDYVNKALDKRGLTFFDARNAVERHAAVATTLGVSLAHLSTDERARLDELAVFPEDADIPLSTLAALWGRSAAIDEWDTEALCERLARLSLLLSFDPTAGVVRLHDVVRLFLLEHIGARLPELHELLLASGQPASALWADLPLNDRYWWSWLFVHLQAVGRRDELLHTALDLRYLAAKTAVRTAFAVESDLRLADEAWPEERSLALLRRRYTQAAHLFGDCRGVAEVRATLYSRLEDAPAVRELVQHAPAADDEQRLHTLHALPDLPHPALVRTLGSHRGAVPACAISPEGRVVAVASSDGRITLWDPRTGIELRSLVAEDEPTRAGRSVRALALSRDGQLLVAAMSNRRLFVWDLGSGALRAQLAGHVDVVTDCALSADGRTLVSSSLDGSLKVWDTASGSLRHSLLHDSPHDDEESEGEAGSGDDDDAADGDEAQSSPVLGCAISADGRLAASASSDQSIIVWDIPAGVALRVLTGHGAAVNACAFDPEGRRLVSAGSDNTLRVWNVQSGEHRAVVAHSHSVNACVFSDDGQRIITASADATVRVWSGDGDELLQTLRGHTDWLNDCAVSSAARLVVSASNDGTAKVWDLYERRDPYRSRHHEGMVHACAALPQQGMALTCAQDGQLMLWQVKRGLVVRHWPAHEGAVRGCAASADGRLLASAGADGAVLVWDGATAARLHTLAGHREWVNACAFDPGAALLASVSNDRTLRLWDLRTRSRRLALIAHEHWINRCAFSPDGRDVVTVCADGSVKRWSLDIDEALWEAWLLDHQPLSPELAARALRPVAYTGHQASVNDCAFSPDGTVLVTASSDHLVKVWERHSGQLIRNLAGHLDEVMGCDVSLDGTRIASVSAEGGVKVWDAADGRCLMSLQVDGSLTACAWTDAGATLVVVGLMGVYFFWCG